MHRIAERHADGDRHQLYRRAQRVLARIAADQLREQPQPARRAGARRGGSERRSDRVFTDSTDGPARPAPRCARRGAQCALVQLQNAIGRAGGVQRVRDQDAAGADRLDRARQQREHDVGGLRVEVAGGFVGQHERRPVHQRARHRHPLQFTARQFARRRAAPIAKADVASRVCARCLRSAAATPSSTSGSSTFCATVRCGRMWKAWNTKPTRARRSRVRSSSLMLRSIAPLRSNIRWPSISMRPASGASRPAIRFSRVDLPAPDSPTTATYSPLSRSRLSSCRMERSPKWRDRPEMRSIGRLYEGRSIDRLVRRRPCGP
jgi:hypothetical protein